MLYRVFLTNERAALAEEKKLAKGMGYLCIDLYNTCYIIICNGKPFSLLRLGEADWENKKCYRTSVSTAFQVLSNFHKIIQSWTRALHWYHRGPGFESHSSLIFFQA